MSELWNVSEVWVHARCAIAEWSDAAETQPPETLNRAADFFNMSVTNVDYVGTSRCVVDVPPPPEMPATPPLPPLPPPSPPIAPPRPPQLPPGYAGIGTSDQEAPPNAPPGECQPGYRNCASQLCTGAVTSGCEQCPPGVYCKLGVQYDCPFDTYGEQAEQSDRGTCLPCPPHSSSPPRSVRKAECRCNLQYMQTGFNETLGCEKCPSGVTTAALTYLVLALT